MYDYLIVGAGLFGSVFAHEAKKRGKSCLVLDKRSHVGGNVYCNNLEGINVHQYGAHIFHTDDYDVWSYVNQFCEFNNFINAPIANYQGEIYNLPFNMNTFNKLWGVVTPQQAKGEIAKQRAICQINEPQNLEEQAMYLIGRDIYQKLIKGYTKKQWEKDPKELPAFIIKRIPVRFTYDNNYFNDKYQGIPIGGYNKMINKMLDGIDVQLDTDYFENTDKYSNIAHKIVYTGQIDHFYQYRFGKLEYRSLQFDHQVLEQEDYQGNAVVNYTDEKVPYTRIIEHKHFEFGKQRKTVITKEYPKAYNGHNEPYYPVNNDRNNQLYQRYKELTIREERVIFGGRLAEYKYYDMDDVIKQALVIVKRELRR